MNFFLTDKFHENAPKNEILNFEFSRANTELNSGANFQLDGSHFTLKNKILTLKYSS